jgi:hypothetical protein
MLWIKIFFLLWQIVFQACMYMWPVSLVLIGILFSELDHAPKKWDCKHYLSLAPLVLSLVMVTFTTAALLFPPLRMISVFMMMLGGGMVRIPQIFMCLQLASAGYAFSRVKGHRCFFLSLLLVELWIGFWCSIVTGGILMRLH